MKQKIILIIICLICVSCTKDKLTLVEEDFDIFVENFRIEANLRSIEIGPKLDNTSIIFRDIDDSTVSGTCNRNDQLITIDPTWWERLSYEEKEHLIFHELGHCVLGRLHFDEETACNDCLSYMRASSTLCSINHYSSFWRTYYLNELFEINNSNFTYLNDCNTEYETIENEVILDTLITDTSYESKEYTIESNIGYEVEFIFKNWIGNVSSVYMDLNNTRLEWSRDIIIYELDHEGQERLYEKSKLYYSNKDFNILEWSENHEEIQINIRSMGEFYYFYFNNKLIHQMENKGEEVVKFKPSRVWREMELNIRYMKITE